jgi:hypothetical protein
MQTAAAAPTELAPGTHLVSPRWGYLHHGIYTGDGRVIHYAGFHRGWRRGPVEEVPWSRFARGRRVQVLHRPQARYEAHTIIERARSRLGEDRYRIWSNNCEHFAHWCVTGIARSEQVESWRRRRRSAWESLAPWWRVERPGFPVVNAD